eukprot:TRINITY_DN10488_c0_g1_i1.p2 TRINITY_DN10488_c0_g1~~TRINITY_DN10488_c0_g1_i1.p2  ORF type:complete len:164 (-),score=8.71 TRINITY_DN10488_c0_g1_i1:1262-1753(-)
MKQGEPPKKRTKERKKERGVCDYGTRPFSLFLCLCCNVTNPHLSVHQLAAATRREDHTPPFANQPTYPKKNYISLSTFPSLALPLALCLPCLCFYYYLLPPLLICVFFHARVGPHRSSTHFDPFPVMRRIGIFPETKTAPSPSLCQPLTAILTCTHSHTLQKS